MKSTFLKGVGKLVSNNPISWNEILGKLLSVPDHWSKSFIGRDKKSLTSIMKNTEETASRAIPYHIGPLILPGGARISREAIAQIIFENKEVIIEQTQSVFAYAQQVLSILHSLNLLTHITRGNVIGDVLGKAHLNLPHARANGKKVYLIPAVDWNSDELRGFMNLDPVAKVNYVRQLESELLEIDHPLLPEDSVPDLTPQEASEMARSMFAVEDDEGEDEQE